MPLPPEVTELSVNWARSIHVDAAIDSDLVQKLTPAILRLRQTSPEPITVGIDSPGGSLASLDVLLGLLTGSDQDGNAGQIITVATNRAYSAAANLLAFGTYSVALRHSEVLYHDVRWEGIQDVTPEKARNAAKSLQHANDVFSLRLAHRIIQRLVWAYIDLQSTFADVQKRFPKTYSKYSVLVASYALPVDGFECVDLASFATALSSRISRSNTPLIRNVMDRLARWIHLNGLSKSMPTHRQKGSRIPGMLDGARYLHKLFKGKPDLFDGVEDNLKLFLSLIVADLSAPGADRVDFSKVLDQSHREYAILQSMNDPKHVEHAANLMARHSAIFFHAPLTVDLEKLSEAERAAMQEKAAPHATLLWHFCVLLCRELFEGEHVLTPQDAQLLGLVDEVAGGGPIQSRREFRVVRARDSSALE